MLRGAGGIPAYGNQRSAVGRRPALRLGEPGVPPGMSAPTAVDFHFDVMCPYAYQTSLWMREVRDHVGRRRDLAVLQPRGDQPGRGQEAPVGARVVLRVVDDAHRRLLRRIDPELLDRWYAGAGTALHVEGDKPHRPEVAEALLARARPRPRAGCAAAIADPTTGDEVRAEHDTVVASAAGACPPWCSPTDPGAVRPGAGRPAHGRRRGAAVARRHRMARVPPPLRAAAAQAPRRHRAIADAFRPYLEARDWITIQNDTP